MLQPCCQHLHKNSRENRKRPKNAKLHPDKSKVSYQKRYFPDLRVFPHPSMKSLLHNVEQHAPDHRNTVRWLYAQSENKTLVSLLYNTNVSCICDYAFASFSRSLPQGGAGYSQDCVHVALSSLPATPCSLLPPHFISAFLPSFWLELLIVSLAAWVHSQMLKAPFLENESTPSTQQANVAYATLSFPSCLNWRLMGSVHIPQEGATRRWTRSCLEWTKPASSLRLEG